MTDISILRLPMSLRLGQVNCYLIRTDAGFILIDTAGPNARKALFRDLERLGCQPGSLKLVLLTHGDFDHIGNAAALRSVFGSKIAMHREDAAMAERGDMFVNRKRPNILIRALIPVFAGFGKTERFTPDILIEEGYDLSPYGFEARVISLPGHSKGSLGVLTAGGEFFCGDLLENTSEPAFGSIMSDSRDAEASAARLKRLSIRTVYPGHGRPFAMERLEQDGIETARRAEGGDEAGMRGS